MSNSNLEVIHNLYQAFAQRDVAALLASLAPGIVWNAAEGSAFAEGSPYIGPAAVGQGVFFRLATEWDDFQAIPAEFFDAGDVIVVKGRYRGTYKANGAALDAQFAHFYTLSDGKITALHQYMDTAQAQRVMGS